MDGCRLKLYCIEDDYIDYLRQFDDKVPYNKHKTRPFVGIVYIHHGYRYFAPLSSPKPKHVRMNERAIDIWKISNGSLGIVNFNNMVPCPSGVLTEILPTVTDTKYKILLENQIKAINNERGSLLKKVRRFHDHYEKGLLSINVINRCCDFQLLEEKCDEYMTVSV
ncbi:MAG: type III toxin-antitoxin system ToxN/AbiQ family toxin [Erysipelotrichaceae bacterium]|nr:type III toxin-antitoxin system ToxN/AbiQ family toxin [Erysipelotrichaceae bacterium]